MNNPLISILLSIVLPLAAFAQETPQSALAGTWTVDLTPAPEAPTYLQEMTVTFDAEKSFSGTFYNTPFDNGEINTAWDKTYFAFSTKDSKSVYFSCGYLDGSELKGMTYCDNRDFVMPWTATRKKN